ncbi:hypothetical protein [Amycolatopsis taiwanensis]|uniref:hypothetical protein n=1 Tax=Amycolatopsis taiwanensis TaxID=342230 RepID=UPI0004B87D04|nr:hypothetical protein [Amycolatopsis taiwanensis]
MAARTDLRAGAGIVVAVVVACVLWLPWLRFADSVAYRAPYGLWRCQIDNGGVIGDPFFVTTGLGGLKFVLLPASFAVVGLVAMGVWRRGRKMWLWFVAAVALAAVATWGYVTVIDAMLYPTYFVPECS